MSFAILGVHPKEILKFEEENLVVISKGNLVMYWTLASEDLKVEYIEERIFIHSPASLEHEKIFRFLYSKLVNYVSEKNLGELLGSRFPIQLTDGRRVEPDIIFLSNKDIKTGKLSNTIFKGIPTFIIEIVSPNYREHDTVTKREEYRKLNVREYWIVDLENKQVEKISFKNNKEIGTINIKEGNLSPNLSEFEDFTINLTDLWNSSL